MSRLRLLAVVLVVGAAVCAFLGIRGEGAVDGTDRGRLGTPLWSVRRVPQPVVDAAGAQRLQAALDAEVGLTNVCFLVSDGDSVLATRAVDRALVPASTEKVLTAAIALAVLGADATLDTRVVATAAPQDGVVDRLWMVGGGDFLLMTPEALTVRAEVPSLRGTPTTALSDLADAVVAAGVRRVPGGIIGDDSRYETLRYLPTWKAEFRTEGQVGPLGALTVDGGFRNLGPDAEPVDDPAVFAASELTRLLQARGVAVGTSSRGAAPAGAIEIAKVQSPPMSAAVGEVLSASDNLGAELLTREIGLHVASQGTTAAGLQAIVQELGELGLPTASTTLVDGSGLDDGNSVTCQLLEATLGLGADSRFSALWTGLAVAGESGTLIEQFDGTVLDGKVRAKTGSLDGVTGLVGLVEVGRPLRFAFIANGPFTESEGAGLRSRVVAVIARYPEVPPTDELVPPPAGEPTDPDS